MAEKRLELASRLKAIPGVSIPEDSRTRRPPFKLGLLMDKVCLTTFLEVFDWVLCKIKKAEIGPVPAEAAPPGFGTRGTGMIFETRQRRAAKKA